MLPRFSVWVAEMVKGEKSVLSLLPHMLYGKRDRQFLNLARRVGK